MYGVEYAEVEISALCYGGGRVENAGVPHLPLLHFHRPRHTLGKITLHTLIEITQKSSPER